MNASKHKHKSLLVCGADGALMCFAVLSIAIAATTVA